MPAFLDIRVSDGGLGALQPGPGMGCCCCGCCCCRDSKVATRVPISDTAARICCNMGSGRPTGGTCAFTFACGADFFTGGGRSGGRASAAASNFALLPNPTMLGLRLPRLEAGTKEAASPSQG
eukprot:6492263-Amphidinium_carterae.1